MSGTIRKGRLAAATIIAVGIGVLIWIIVPGGPASAYSVISYSGTSYGFNDPDALADDGTHVWVGNYQGNSVTELNASNGTLVQVISDRSHHFNRPDAIAVDGTSIWVASQYNIVTELHSS